MSFNILLIVIDTLRKDHAKYFNNILSKYDFKYYGRAISPSPWTLPSHASLFTGLYPLYHGAHETKHIKLHRNLILTKDIKIKRLDFLITKLLKEFEYNTYSYSANILVHPIFGFRYFDHYYLHLPSSRRLLSFEEKRKIEHLLKNENLTKIDIIKKILKERNFSLFLRLTLESLLYRIRELKRNFCRTLKCIIIDKGSKNIISNFIHDVKKQNHSKSPSFIFINFMEMHEPYTYNSIFLEGANFNKKRRKNINKELIKKAYRRDALYLASKIDKLLDFLSERTEFDDLLIIITSDHGQLLGEYDRYGHGIFLDDELIRVPLWIKYPKNYEISKFETEEKWVSFVNIKNFLISALKNKVFDEKLLYSSIVFSESYGVISHISDEEIDEYEKYERYNRYRIAIYYKDYKGIFNIENWEFERIISYQNKEVPEDVKVKMKREIIKYLSLSIPFKHNN